MITEKNFWLYTTGMFISLMGSGVQDIALPLFILDLTGSGTIMGTFMILSVAPRLVLYPFAGVVGDRVNRKWIMVSTDFGRGILILVLALLAAKNFVTIPVLFAAQIMISLMNALFRPATRAMLPDIVKEEDLMQANSVVEVVDNFSYIVGPILGGIIYGIGGIKLAFLINGLSFLGSGVSELFIRYQQKTKKLEKLTEVVTDFKEGIHFIRTHRGLLILLVFALLINFLYNPIFGVFIPYVLRVVIQFSSEQFGLLQTSIVVGILIGNVILGMLFAKSTVEKMVTRSLIIRTGLLFIFVILIFPHTIQTLNHGSWAMFCAVFLAFILMGIFNAFVNTPLSVGLQKLIPTEYRARVLSVGGLIAEGIVPIGYGIIGIALDRAPAYIIALFLSLLLLFVILLFVLKYLKETWNELDD